MTEFQPGTFSGSPPVSRFAINTPKFYEAGDDGKYGSATLIASDLLDLGATIARHPGRLQLFFDQCYTGTTTYEHEGMDYTVPALTLDDIDQDTLDSTVAASDAIAHLAELVGALGDDSNLRLIITLFNLGAGSPTDFSTVPWGPGTSEPTNPPYYGPIGLRWHPDHFAHTIVDGLTGDTLAFPNKSTSSLTRWDELTVDPRNPYKREVYRRMGLAGELVTGIDYHYYHRKPNEAQLMAYLVAELSELRGKLDGAMQGALLSVTESGVNVVCDGDEDGYADPPGYDAGCEAAEDEDWESYRNYSAPGSASKDYRPPRYSWTAGVALEQFSTTPANDFQGISVWLRLAVAMAGGADIVGWHTHMANNDNAFAGIGLRRDFHDQDVGPYAAAARPAWFAFRRLTHLLGGATEVRVLTPDLSDKTHEGIDSDLEAGKWTAEQQAWVIEFRGASMTTLDRARAPEGSGLSRVGDGWWAYLVFTEPSPPDASEKADAARVYFVNYRDSSEDVTVYTVATQPTASTLMTGPDDTYPPQTWSFEPASMRHPVALDASTPYAYPVTTGRAQWPRLVMSPQRLRLLPDIDVAKAG